MFRVPRAVAGVALVVSLAGCARAGGTANPPGQEPSGAGAPTSGCARNVVVHDPADGSTACVALGSDLIVMFTAAGTSSWSTPRVTGPALGTGSGVPTPAGQVGWMFPAVAAGASEITLSRPGCPAASPGAVRCLVLTAVRLHVDVRQLTP
jgi:hypothetical protein